MSLVFERGVFLSHKGLNKEIIIKAAADLIETQGCECFSMRLQMCIRDSSSDP